MTLLCKFCGAENILPKGKIDMFCAYCGTSIKICASLSLDENPLKYKPVIDEGEEGSRIFLVNKGIKQFDEISCWFTSSELVQIKTLDVTNNKISSWDGVEKFTGLKFLNLNKNNITSLPSSSVDFIENIFLLYTPIAYKLKEGNLKYNTNITIEEYVPCTMCDIAITQHASDNQNGLCLNCAAEVADKKLGQEVFDSIMNDKDIRKIFMPPQPSTKDKLWTILIGCILMIIVLFLLYSR